MMGFTFGELLKYVSPSFVVVKPKKSDDTKLEKLKEYFARNFIQSKERSMDDVIQELEDHFTFRLVVDFRKLNKRVIPDPYPIPRAKELNRIAKKKVHKTSLDLKYGFVAMGFYRDHSKFMAVITPFGIFVPTRLGFGGSNGPAYMQRLSDYVYGDLEDVCVYIDDILIASADWTSHLESLREVFQRTRDAKLRIAVNKVKFALFNIDYVGLYLTKDGIKPQEVHTNTIIQFAVPQDVKTLKSFLALCNYCGDFIPNFATIAEPLTKLLRKTQPWIWTQDQQESFERLKSLIANLQFWRIQIIPSLLFCILMLLMWG